MPIPNIVDGWGHAYYFKLEPIERKVLTENVDRVVYKGTQEWNWFHTLPLIFLYPGKKTVLFRKEYFLKEGDDRKLYKEYIEGDIIEAVKKQFPAMPVEQIEVAIEKSKNYQAERKNKE